MMMGTRSGKSTTTDRVRVYDTNQQLDSEKEYSRGQQYYFFEMRIPKDILSVRLGTTGLAPSYPIKWYLLAKLDIPGRPDIRRKVDITIAGLEHPPDLEVRRPSISLGGPPSPGL